jgi:hypothetical protein
VFWVVIGFSLLDFMVCQPAGAGCSERSEMV